MIPHSSGRHHRHDDDFRSHKNRSVSHLCGEGALAGAMAQWNHRNGQPGNLQKAGTLAMFPAAGAETRFLPAYSPSLTQIGKMWKKLKVLLRKAVARSPEQFDEAIGSALNQIARNGARGWLAS